MIYLYHITFFGAFLALTGYWEEENRHCLTFKKVLPLSEAGNFQQTPIILNTVSEFFHEDRILIFLFLFLGEKSKTYQLFCAGGVSRSEKPSSEMTKHALMHFFKTKMAKFLCIPAIKVRSKVIDFIKRMARKKCGISFIQALTLMFEVIDFIKRMVPKKCGFSFIQALILMMFVAYLAVGGWGISQLNEGLQAKRLSLDDSYYVEFFDRNTEYFNEFPLRIMVSNKEPKLTFNPQYIKPGTKSPIFFCNRLE